MLGKFIGSIMIVIGTAIGAGMLALPMVSAAMGFHFAAILVLAIWVLTTTTAFLLLEVNLAFKPYRNNFSTMARATLGKSGEIIVWIAYLLLFYALTAAYIAGNASLLTNLFSSWFLWHIPNWISALLFILVLGGAVFWSTATVDYLNRGLLSVKGILLIATLLLLMPHIDFKMVSSHFAIKYAWVAAPIFLCSFGFHNVIPTISNYQEQNPKNLRAIIFIGSTTTLIIYLLWLLTTLGIVPLEGNNSFLDLTSNNGSVGEFINIISVIIHNRWIALGIEGFANIAMTTSFLGVSLGLFDFLADGFKCKNTRLGRSQTSLLTFIPPLVFVLFFPQGFILALGYASIFVAIIVIVLPALMAYKLRKSKQLVSPYRVKLANVFLFVICGVGILLIIIQILSSLHLLPILR